MSVVDYPLVTEKAMDAMDFENALQFVVDTGASKPEIRDEIEQRYEVEVADVNTMVTPDGRKKATVALTEDHDAEDLAARIGVF
ncbi:MAG: 50S ribosomal protein L23 [Halobacteriaceae archaeon]